MRQRPRLLIEEWLPAAAIGVECIRERSTGQQPPDKRLHIWWARRPLTASRAAVLGSLLPADFPREVFERLLGFGRPGDELVSVRRRMDAGERVDGGFNCKRAFTNALREDDLALAHKTMTALWGSDVTVIDPMAGGGSIPLEAARLGIRTLANEYNPVACSVLEATVDYPFRFGEALVHKVRKWARVWEERCTSRLAPFYPKEGFALVHAYIFARTVPCPDTGYYTPLVPDWHLLKPKSGRRVVAEPVVDPAKGTWTVRIREVGSGPGQLREAPRPTYSDGKGISLFTQRQIPAEYIKAKAQQGEMKSALYAVALKTPQGLRFRPPEMVDLEALAAAEEELARMRPGWEQANVIPTELYPEVSSDGRPRLYGMPRWADLFSPRQLLAMGVLVEELRRLRPEIYEAEGPELGAAIEHILGLVLDKILDYNNALTTWETQTAVVKHLFQRHDFSFKATYGEMPLSGAGIGLDWAIDNVLEAYEHLAQLPRHPAAQPVQVSLGSATSLPQIRNGSVTAVVVDPPYADNVQYSDLADFFYVWLKRTQGHRRPEWFSTYLCERDQEAVMNVSRHRGNVSPAGRRKGSAREALDQARAFYQRLMTDAFSEMRRILRDDGVLTVMFTHKKQEAWEALFKSLIDAGFTITATWPVKTESEHSLHQAKKNAAQSTVILVARKRPAGAGVGYFDAAMKAEIRQRARDTAARLEREGLNAVDQLVGSFGPAMEVFSQYDEVRTDTGQPVTVGQAIDEASDAVSRWRIEKLAARGLDGVEPEGQFVLLCWDVLGAAEFRFNEAKLLGHAVGMDVDQLVAAGLVSKSGDKVRMLSARERRREYALEPDQMEIGPVPQAGRRRRREILKVHPNDPSFRTALDACHALALRYLEAGGGAGGIGSARALVHRHRWTKDSAVARLMEALVRAAPEAVRHEAGRHSVAAQYPEFRAWHALLQPLFGIDPPDWTPRGPSQLTLDDQVTGGPADEGEPFDEDEEDFEDAEVEA